MPLTRTLTTGMTGDDVAVLQKALRALDISVQDRDGDFRESTRRAVVLFQRGNRLRITGSFGPRELDTLVEKSIQRDVERGRVAFKLETLPDPAMPSSEEVMWALSRVARRGEEEAHEVPCEPILHSYLVNRFLAHAPRSRRRS